MVMLQKPNGKEKKKSYYFSFLFTFMTYGSQIYEICIAIQGSIYTLI